MINVVRVSLAVVAPVAVLGLAFAWIVPMSPAALAATNAVANPGFEQARCGEATPDGCGRWLASQPSRAAAAQASINVVPNASFEAGDCGSSTPVICGWASLGGSMLMFHAGGRTSGSFGMGFQTQCGVIGCYPSGYETFSASTDPAFCAAISPGTHAASFWASGDGVLSLEPGSADLEAVFYSGSDCSGRLGSDSIGGSLAPDGSWQQLSGVLVAPAGTQSVLFTLGGAVPWLCDDWCGGASAYVDDVDVEDALLSDTTPPETTIDFGPSGTTNSTSATFEFTASEPATFECSLDAAPFSACTSPASDDGLADGSHTFSVQATDSAGNIEPTPAERTWTVDTRPLTIDSFTPSSAPPGTSVTITGTGFIDVRGVFFNGAYGGFTVDSPTSITAQVPKQATSGPISVQTTTGNATSSSPFTITCESPGPIISAVTPMSGPVGTDVSISGANFADVTQVAFTGETAIDFTINSPTSITTTVPEYATSGPIRVETYSSACTTGSSFTVTWPAPTISSFTPTSGPTGAQVEIQGTSFHDVTNVMFDGKAATTWQLDSLTHLTAWVPSGATSGPVSITASGQTGTSSDSFTVIAPPLISSFTPTSGPIGTTVTISGSNLTGATSVKLNGTTTGYTVNSATSITATVPNGATSGPITVTTPYGTSTSTSSFTVTLPPLLPPTITGFSPTSGRVGQLVTITGSNFTGTTDVELGTASAKFTINSPTQLTATVPSNTHGYYKWTVTSPAGTAISSNYFRVR